MKKLIFAIILLIIAIGAVSAADSNATAHARFDDASLEVPNDNSGNAVLELADNQEDTLQSPKKSSPAKFDELQSKVNRAKSGSTLYLDRDYLYGEDFSTTRGIVITKPITIDGRGHEIVGSFDSPIFIIKADNVVLKNLVLKEGLNEEAGAISVYSNHVKFINCSFIDNQASFDYGGAIYLDHCRDISFTSCRFVFNFAFFNGGSIFLDHCSDFSFTGCYFSYYDDIYLNHCRDFSFTSCTFYLYISKQYHTVRSTIFTSHCSGYSFKSCTLLHYIDNSRKSTEIITSDTRDDVKHHIHYTSIIPKSAPFEKRYYANKIEMLANEFYDFVSQISDFDNKTPVSTDISKSISVDGFKAYDYTRIPMMIFAVFVMMLLAIVGYGKIRPRH